MIDFNHFSTFLKSYFLLLKPIYNIKRALILLPLIFSFTACEKTSATETVKDTTSKELKSFILLPNTRPKVSYDLMKKSIENNRLNFSKKYNSISDPTKKASILQDARAYITSTISDSLFTYWYGTHWDFNGITNIPGEGEIACGYFVSTTLKHTGFNLNRYKLAQQAALNIAKSINGNKSLITVNSMNDLQAYLWKQPDGLYILGLDFHVGYVCKKDSNLIFIHSTYLSPTCVLQEQLAESEAANLSRSFVITKAFPDEMMVKWLKGEPVKIYTH